MRRCTCPVLIALCRSWPQPGGPAQHDQHDPGPLPKYVAEPIALFKVGLGPFTRRSPHQSRSAGVLRPGLPDDVRLRAPRRGALVPRSVEARSRVRDLLLGRRLGVGLVPERPDVRRAVAVRLCGDAEGDQPASDKATPIERAFIDALAVRYVKNFDVEEARGAGPGLRRRDGARSPRSIPNDLDADHAVRRRAVPARAAPRHARRQRAQHQAPARRARIGAGEGLRSIPAPAISTCTPPSPPCGRSRPRPAREFLGKTHSRRQPHQSHAVAHVERSRPLGRFGARQSRGVALGSEGRRRRRLRDLSRSQPAHAALRRVDGRPGRASPCRPARTTPSAPATRCITR